MRWNLRDDDHAVHDGTAYSVPQSTPTVAPTGRRAGVDVDEYEREEWDSDHDTTGNGASNTTGHPAGVHRGEAPIATQRSKPNWSAGVSGSRRKETDESDDTDHAKRKRRRKNSVRPIV